MTIDSLTGEELLEEQLRWHRAHIQISQDEPKSLLKCAAHLIGGTFLSIPLLDQVTRFAIERLCDTRRESYYFDYLETKAFDEAMRLVEKGINPSTKSRCGKTFIDYLIEDFQKKNYRIIAKVLKKGGEFNPSHPNLAACFDFAIECGDFTGMALLSAGGFVPSTELMEKIPYECPLNNEPNTSARHFYFNPDMLPPTFYNIVNNKAPDCAFNSGNKQIEVLIEALQDNNVFITGETGGGKGSIVKLLEERIGQGKIPDKLKDKIVLEMSLYLFRSAYQKLLKSVRQLLSHNNLLVVIRNSEGVSDKELDWLRLVSKTYPVRFILTTEDSHSTIMLSEKNHFTRIHLEPHTSTEQLHCIKEAQAVWERYYGVEVSSVTIKKLLEKVREKKENATTKDLLNILHTIFKKLSNQYKKEPILIERLKNEIEIMKQKHEVEQYLPDQEKMPEAQLKEKELELEQLKEQHQIIAPILIEKRKLERELKIWTRLATQINDYPAEQKILEEKTSKTQKALEPIERHLAKGTGPFLKAPDEALLDECIKKAEL